ncbi:zinc finger protein OZF isoform X1 [Anabrus simplex]|uniref:zinc finger protein OZF isoform X1 n=1 Tax=Anabrus simplex TaxID=316456 RepID=UPI0035A2BFA4
MLNEMDMEVNIKEEPVWLEEAAETSHEDRLSGMIHIKEESKSELAEPGPSQDNVFEECFQLQSTMTCLKEETEPELEPGPTQSAAIVKDELSVEEHITDQHVLYFNKEKRFENFAEMTQHTRTGESSHCCTVCSMVSSRKLNIKKRISKPPADETYQCKLCKSTFSQRNDLRNHKLTHSNVKRYRCDVCNSTFRLRSNLKAHMSVHSEEWPYGCNVCNSTFARRNNLRTHMLSHSQEWPYLCNVCNSTYRLKSALKQHMLVHSGERPHRCDVCNSSYRLRSTLKQHMLIHSGERPHRCNICNCTFSRLSRLQTHLRNHPRGKSRSRKGAPVWRKQ